MGNVKFESNIPEFKKLLWAAQNKALKEIGKYVVSKAKEKVVVADKSYTVYVKGKKRKIRKGAVKGAIGYYVFRKEQRVLVGIRPRGWWGGFFELGTSEIPKQPFLTPAVVENIDTIRKIEAEVMREELMK